MESVYTGVASPISLQLFDGAVDRYPKAYVKTAAGAVVTDLPLTHQSNGNYVAMVTFPASGYYFVTFIVYTDVARTIEDTSYTYRTDFYRSEDSTVLTPDDLEAIAAAIWRTEKHYDLDMTTSISCAPDAIEFLVWMDLNQDTIEIPTSAEMSVFDGAGTLVFAMPVSTSPNAQGVFNFTKAPASVLLRPNKTYVASITIVHGTKTLQRLKSFTIF